MIKFKDIQEVVFSGESPFKTEKEVFRHGDEFIVSVKQELPRCVHGHLIHNPGEMIGQCMFCKRYVCKQCEMFRCSLDNDLVCREHCIVKDGRVICHNHGFIRRVLFLARSKS